MRLFNNLSLYKKIVAVGIAIITILLANGLRYAQFDSQMRATSAKKFSEDRALIIIHDKNLFSPEKLKAITQLQDQISQLDRVNSVQSLYNTPDVYSYFNQYQGNWHSILENKKYNKKDSAQAKTNALANKFVVNRFIDSKANTIALYANIKSTKYSMASLETRKKIQNLLNQNGAMFSNIYQVGLLDFRQEINDSALHDTKIIMPTIILITLFVFSFLFKSLLSAFCPLVIFTFTAIWTVGIISYLGIPLNMMVTIVLVYVYSISIVESAFFLNAFSRARAIKPALSKYELLKQTYKMTLVPALLATSTTMLGFAFNSFSTAATIKNFAITISIAIIISIIICVALMPFFLERILLTPLKETPYFNKISQWAIRLNTGLNQHRKKLAVLFVGFVLLSICAALHIQTNALPYAFINSNSAFYQKLLLTQKYLTGIDSYKVKLISKQPGFFYEKNNLEELLTIENKINKINGTSTTLSIATAIASTYQLYLGNQKEFNIIPERQEVTDRFLDELSKQKEIKKLLNANGDSATIAVNFSVHNSQELKQYQEKLSTILNLAVKNHQQLHYELIGFVFDYDQVLSNLVKLQFVSLIIIFLLTFGVLIFLLKNYRVALVAFVPNMIPIGAIFITLWIFNYPLNAINIIVFAIIAGLSVDDTIHIIHSYKEHFLLSQNRDDALKSALSIQVRPVTITTIALLLGMLTLQLSSLDIIKQTGILFMVGIITAWLADISITPLLLRVINITKRLRY